MLRIWPKLGGTTTGLTAQSPSLHSEALLPQGSETQRYPFQGFSEVLLLFRSSAFFLSPQISIAKYFFLKLYLQDLWILFFKFQKQELQGLQLCIALVAIEFLEPYPLRIVTQSQEMFCHTKDTRHSHTISDALAEHLKEGGYMDQHSVANFHCTSSSIFLLSLVL